jgi:hypothetical protein
MEAAWPGLAVEDSNLTVQIAALRRALGEVPGGSRVAISMSVKHCSGKPWKPPGGRAPNGSRYVPLATSPGGTMSRATRKRLWKC